MRSSAECQTKFLKARVAAESVIDDPKTQAHFENVARDWLDLAVMALVQEEREAKVIDLENAPVPPRKASLN
jgi:hypothetical protein